MNIFTKEKTREYLFLLFLLAALILTFGLKIGKIGFYWDDLPNTFFEANGGARAVLRAVSTGRRAIAPLYSLTFWVLGENPLAWQIFAILSRWLLIAVIYQFLMVFEPQNRLRNQQITLMMLIYPGFQQQWISKTYPPIFFVFVLEFISLSIFLKGVRENKPILTVVSLILSFYCLHACEYVFGLEFMRPVLVYFEFSKPKHELDKKLLKKAFIKWLPFLISLIVFIILRTYFANSSLYNVETASLIGRSPLAALTEYVSFSFDAIFNGIFTSWQQIFTRTYFSTSPTRILLFTIAIAGFCTLFLMYQNKLCTNGRLHPKITQPSHKGLFWLAIASLIFAGVPFWAADLSPAIGFPNNRFFLSFMFGSSILVYLISTPIKSHKLRNIYFVIFFCFGSLFHFNAADKYVESWQEFQALMQQISWRAPAIKQNSFLVAEQLPISFYSDNSLTSTLNWLYAVDRVDKNLPIQLDYTEVRLGKSLKTLDANQPIHHKFLIYEFNGSTDEMLVLFQQPGRCLHIALPGIDDFNPDVPEILEKAVSLSNLNQIELVKKQRDIFFLQIDNVDDWCYYYQKASLAYQFEDWPEIVNLGTEAFRARLHPNDLTELIPFIFGYSFTDDWNKAVQLTRSNFNTGNVYQVMMCQVWNIIDTETSESEQKTWALKRVQTELACPELQNY